MKCLFALLMLSSVLGSSLSYGRDDLADIAGDLNDIREDINDVFVDIPHPDTIAGNDDGSLLGTPGRWWNAALSFVGLNTFGDLGEIILAYVADGVGYSYGAVVGHSVVLPEEGFNWLTEEVCDPLAEIWDENKPTYKPESLGEYSERQAKYVSAGAGALVTCIGFGVPWIALSAAKWPSLPYYEYLTGPWLGEVWDEYWVFSERQGDRRVIDRRSEIGVTGETPALVQVDSKSFASNAPIDLNVVVDGEDVEEMAVDTAHSVPARFARVRAGHRRPHR